MRGMLVAAAAVVVPATGPALAADLPTPSLPPPSPAAVYNWTGFYLGINGGFGTGNSNWSDGVIGTTGSFPTSGFLVGGTSGVNYQIAEYVFGIEGDGDWTNLRGNSGSTCGAISAVVTAAGILPNAKPMARNGTRPRRLCLRSHPPVRNCRRRLWQCSNWPQSSIHLRQRGRSGLDRRRRCRSGLRTKLDSQSGISVR